MVLMIGREWEILLIFRRVWILGVKSRRLREMIVLSQRCEEALSVERCLRMLRYHIDEGGVLRLIMDCIILNQCIGIVGGLENVLA